ncbi:MAG: efflux RND transporter periplasmic adaptor subunit, partial [Tannerella sp.]|nr:efflux RND transporter periplasmic adaptor subunit [Tannerella sp.]
RSTASSERNYVGTVEESTAVSLSFSSMGTIEQVFVAEGQQVRKGQTLAVLSSATAQNSLDATQASLQQAQDAYDRLTKLHNNGSLPDIKFVEVETGLQQAKAMEAIARKNLDDCRLCAPVDGVVARRSAEPGANATPGMTAFKLVTVDRVNIAISVPENEIGSTATGQDAVIAVPALDNQIFTGKITLKGVAANPLSHTYTVKIGVDNPQAQLMPGMVCKVRIGQDGESSAIVVPNRAVQSSHDGRRFVWLAVSDVAQRRFVETGALADAGVTVEQGLSEGDRLIVEGCQKISEGMKINVVR